MKRKGLLIVSICFIGLMGCGVEKHILEEILIAEVVGFDEEENNQIKGTTVVSVSRPGVEATRGKDVYQMVSHSIKDVRQTIGKEAPFPIVGGRLDVILYGEKLARKGLNSFMDTHHRDPNLGRDLFIGIVEGQADQVVKEEAKMTKTAGVYLKELIEHNTKTNLPENNFHSFFYSSHGKGMDPVVPLLTVKGDKVEIKGIALMKKDVYIGEYIPFNQGILFKSLYERPKGGSFELKWKENSYINISNVSSNSNYEISNANDRPSVKISVKMKGRLIEIQGYDLYKKPDIKKIEAIAERDLQRKMKDMVNRFQEYDIDPLAIGDRARSKTRNFNQKHWEDIYPTIPITVELDLVLIHEGISE